MNKLTAKQGLLSAVFGLAAGASVGILPLILMIFPALLGFVGTAWGYGALGIASAAACGVIFGQTATLGLTNCIGYAAMLLSQSFIIAFVFKTKGAYRTAVAYCVFAASLSQYCATCLMPLIELGDPFAHYTEFATYFADALLNSGAELGLEQGALDQLGYLAAYMKRCAPDIAVISIVGTSMLGGLLNVIIAKGLCKKFKTDLKKMAPFHKWQLSRSFHKGSLILVAGALIISFTSINNVTAIMMAISLIVIGPYALMGLCFLVFSFKFRKKGRGIIMASSIMMLLLFPYSLYGLCLMGLADRLMGIRRRAGKIK